MHMHSQKKLQNGTIQKPINQIFIPLISINVERINDILNIIWYHPKTTDVSHALMAKKYIKLLAEALREFDNNRYDVEYYMYTAWSGAMQAGKDLGFLKSEFASEHYEKHKTLLNAEIKFCDK